MTQLRAAEREVQRLQKIHDLTEHAYLYRRHRDRAERERHWRVYQDAARQLQNALDARDRLRARAGRHPYLNLVQGYA